MMKLLILVSLLGLSFGACKVINPKKKKKRSNPVKVENKTEKESKKDCAKGELYNKQTKQCVKPDKLKRPVPPKDDKTNTQTKTDTKTDIEPKPIKTTIGLDELISMKQSALERIPSETIESAKAGTPGLWVIESAFTDTNDGCMAFLKIDFDSLQYRRFFICDTQNLPVEIEVGILEKTFATRSQITAFVVKPLFSSCLQQDHRSLYSDALNSLSKYMMIVEEVDQFDETAGRIALWEKTSGSSFKLFSIGTAARVNLGTSLCSIIKQNVVPFKDKPRANLSVRACELLDQPLESLIALPEAACVIGSGANAGFRMSPVRVVN